MKILGKLLLVCGLFFSHALYANTAIVFESKPEQQLKQVLGQLDLSTEQKQKISQFMREIEPEFVQNLAKTNANNMALAELVGAKYDAVKVAQLADAEGKVVAEMIKLRLKVRHKIFEILTPAQRLKVEKLLSKN